MKHARHRSTDDTEQSIIEWAAWVQGQLDAQGWGGGLDIGHRSTRAPGVHADPLLAELLRTEAAGQGISQRVHRHLTKYSREISRDWMRVVWARFVGVPAPVAMQTLTGTGPIQIGISAFWSITVSVEVPRAWKWSGLQDWERVSKQTNISVRSAQAMLSLVKRQLAMDLRMDRRIGRGQVMPDGPASAAEKRAALVAHEAREVERAARENAEAEREWSNAA